MRRAVAFHARENTSLGAARSSSPIQLRSTQDIEGAGVGGFVLQKQTPLGLAKNFARSAM
jgi:hypothetical protein